MCCAKAESKDRVQVTVRNVRESPWYPIPVWFSSCADVYSYGDSWASLPVDAGMGKQQHEEGTGLVLVVQVAVVGRNCRDDQQGYRRVAANRTRETRPPTRNGRRAKSTRTRFWQHVFVVPLYVGPPLKFLQPYCINYSEGRDGVPVPSVFRIFCSLPVGERVRRGADFVSVPERLFAQGK
jgi:hypothetical protein